MPTRCVSVHPSQALSTAKELLALKRQAFASALKQLRLYTVGGFE